MGQNQQCFIAHHSETGTQRGIRRRKQKAAAHGARGCFRERLRRTRFSTSSSLLQMQRKQQVRTGDSDVK